MKTLSPFTFKWRKEPGYSPAEDRLATGARSMQFNQLIVPHLDGAYNLARYLTCDPVLAEDVVQDAFLRAFRSFAQFQGSSPRAWLFAIVRNCCRTTQARARTSLALVVHESGLGEEGAAKLLEHADPDLNPEEQLLRCSQIEQVRDAIEAIPEPFREAVVLRELEGLAYAEIAEVTNVPLGTVMSRLARGRAMLADRLLPPGDAAEEQSRSVK